MAIKINIIKLLLQNANSYTIHILSILDPFIFKLIKLNFLRPAQNMITPDNSRLYFHTKHSYNNFHTKILNANYKINLFF